VIFDEFHERSLDADLGLALCRDLQGVLNEDLRLLVMSATLDTGPVASLLGDAPVISCRGRVFEVETRHLVARRDLPVERRTADAVLRAAAEETGSILVFLPGAAEIGRVERLLRQKLPAPEYIVAPLYGNLTRAQQDRAIAPAPPGKRKVVLATSIAETSLTIEGIHVVVDSGLMRVPRFDVCSAMTRLETVTVSRSSADQRRGRAGRTAPGVCYRLWPPEGDAALVAANRPEILEADLASLVLELAIWGVDDPGALAWLNPPPAAAFSRARELLREIGALDSDNRATGHGRRISRLPLHPRLAHMVLLGKEEGLGALACDLAALATERDMVRFGPGEADADIGLRAEIVQRLRREKRLPQGPWHVDRAAARRVAAVAEQLKKRLRISDENCPLTAVGRLLARAYPDRIAQRRPTGIGRYLLANGRGAYLPAHEPLATEDWLVAASLDGDRQEAKIFLAAPYDEETLRRQYGNRVMERETVDWDPRQDAVTAVVTRSLGALVLESKPIRQADPSKILAALFSGIRQQGIECLPWTKALRQWQARVLFLRRVGTEEENWPEVSDAGLADSLETWLAPWAGGTVRLRDLVRIDLKAALAGLLSGRQRHLLNRLAPTHWIVPSGSRLPIDYSGEVPVLAVRLQEMFGTAETPAVADGRQPLLLHLLSPAGRPAQVTRDLAGFWKNAYIEVKKELKGRYPKHYWPDDPLAAAPTRRAKPRQKKKMG
jgi:ATP-dependent helicase HrpB